jgi:hypothetical protein
LRKLTVAIDVFSYVSDEEKMKLLSEGILPVSIEPAYSTLLENGVGILNNTEITDVKLLDSNEYRVNFSTGLTRDYDIIVAATGYRPDVKKLDYIDDILMSNIKLNNGYPLINGECESTVPGLYFLGSLSLMKFGPQVNFIFGRNNIVPRAIGDIAAKTITL